MAKNNLPKTAVVVLDGVQLTINQNGRVMRGAASKGVQAKLIDGGYLTCDCGMLFVSLDTLGKAFGL